MTISRKKTSKVKPVQGTTFTNCTVGGPDPLMASAIIALASACEANAKAISDIATKSGVKFETGIRIGC